MTQTVSTIEVMNTKGKPYSPRRFYGTDLGGDRVGPLGEFFAPYTFTSSEYARIVADQEDTGGRKTKIVTVIYCDRCHT